MLDYPGLASGVLPDLVPEMLSRTRGTFKANQNTNKNNLPRPFARSRADDFRLESGRRKQAQYGFGSK